MLNLDAGARAVFAANRYMVLGTADEDGRPWTTPVWYAREGYEELYWVSSPQTRHSRNIAARPQISIVVFDSQVPVGSAAAVYMQAIGAGAHGRRARSRDGGVRARGRGAGPAPVDRSPTSPHRPSTGSTAPP